MYKRRNRTTRKKRMRENRIIRVIIEWALLFLIAIASIFIFMTALYFTMDKEPDTDEEVAEEMMEQRERENIKNGTITVYASGGVYVYVGNIKVIDDGEESGTMEIILDGWQTEGYEHGEPKFIGGREVVRSE